MPAEYLLQITRGWMGKIKKAADFKQKEFGDDAEEAMAFFDGPYDFMYTSKYATKSGAFSLADQGAPSPTFRMTMNKVAEMVQLFGPVLYHRNPFRQVNMRNRPEYPYEMFGDLEQDPEAAQAAQQIAMRDHQSETRRKILAELLQFYLNYTPNELGLANHARNMVDEAIIKGMGLMWIETYRPLGSPIKYVGSFYDSVDNLIVDPDMESIRDAKWIARRRVMPVWEVERKFGLKKGELKTGSYQSANMQGEYAGDPEYEYFHQRGDTNDLMVFWEIYSRMGMGHLMSKNNLASMGGLPNDEYLAKFGAYVYLAVCENYPSPLNLPERVSKSASMQEQIQRTQWPTPFWADATDPWPFVYLEFHPRPRKVWPMSHLKPGMGELKFLNWAYSFMADKIKNTSRDFIAVRESANEEVRTALLSGRDLSLLPIEPTNTSINEVVQFLQHADFKPDLYNVIEAVTDVFEKRVGLNELMYGMSRRQMRSAQEAQVKGDQLRVRPDDMAAKLEVTMTSAARKEGLACRWHIDERDVLPIIGQDRTQLWASIVMQSDIYDVVQEVDYRIEAGTIRKPNRDRDIANVNQAVQVWGPVFQGYAQMTGDFSPMNALAKAWAKAYDMDADEFQMQPPPPPQPDTSGLEMQQAEHEQKLMHKDEEHQLKVMQKSQEHEAKLGMGGESHQQDSEHKDDDHVQELTQDQERHIQEMIQAKEAGRLDLTLKRMLASASASNQNGNSNGD
jgi:hypothetical protein